MEEEPEQGVCSEDNLYACSTEAECVDAGGEWYIKSACVEKGSSTYTPYTPPASSSTSTSTSTVSGTNWFSFLSLSASSPVEVPVPCDAQHPEGCDQGGCESLLGEGFWWYDGACRAEPVEVNYPPSRIRESPVSPGVDAEDGIISAGEGLSFKVNVPAGGRMYAVLSIPDVGAFFISNDEIITAVMKPVASGTIPVIDDICPYLSEELMGIWTVYTLTVPASVGESLDELSDYLFQQGGLYALGSYQMEVNCQEVEGLKLYDIPRPQ
jgi:hypothetical protein